MEKYQHGFVLGKFMPLHTGHLYLLDTAQDSCEKLTILLCSMPTDPIPGDIRLEWLKYYYPNAKVVHHPDPLPRDQNRSDFWDLWSASIQKYCSIEDFDVVFTSESYGDRLAEEFNTKHVLVDLDRGAYPISGTDIRNDPKKYWEFIPEEVRKYYE